MAEYEQELGVLMQRLREGSQEAAQELWERYGAHVLRVVRRKLDKKLRAKYDSADLAQAVWASFFVNPTHDYTFDRPEELLAFLARLAENKLVDLQRQRYRTRKYNVNRERPLAGAADSALHVADHQASPSELAMAQEEWERLLAGQQARDQRILDLLRQGHTHEEVARQLGISTKTIHRLLRKLDPGSARP